MTEEQSALIARIEAATGQDDAIDLAIATWCFNNGGMLDVTYDPQLWIIRCGGEFTGSVDWAIRLVPADYWWGIIMRSAENSGFSAAVLPPDTAMVWHVGATPALALCLAALRARWA